MASTPFKMKGFSGFGNKSPLKQGIPVKQGESYKNYLDRAFKQTKDPYGQDVLSKRGYSTQARQLKQDAKKTTRGVYKGVKKKIKGTMQKMGASDKTIQKASRVLTKGKQFAKRVPKVGPGGVVAQSVAMAAYPVVKKVVKATQKKLKTEAKERSTKSAQTLFRGPKY